MGINPEGSDRPNSASNRNLWENITDKFYFWRLRSQHRKRLKALGRSSGDGSHANASEQESSTLAWNNLSDNPKANPETTQLIRQVLPNRVDRSNGLFVSDREYQIIHNWNQSRIPEEEIIKKLAQARSLTDYLAHNEGYVVDTETVEHSLTAPKVSAADSIKQLWEAAAYWMPFGKGEHDGGLVRLKQIPGLEWNTESLQVFIAEGIIRKDDFDQQHKDAIDPFLEPVNKKVTEIDGFINKHHPLGLQITPSQADKLRIGLLPDEVFDKRIGFGIGSVGLYTRSSDKIIINTARLTEGISNASVLGIVHEEMHRRAEKGNPGYKDRLNNHLGAENATKLEEGLAEFAAEFVSDEPVMRNLIRGRKPISGYISSKDKTLYNWFYRSQVAVVHDWFIPTIMKKNGFNNDQAAAVVLSATRIGAFDQLVDLAGGINKTKSILSQVPNT